MSASMGARISMIKFLILVVGLLFVAVPLAAAQAQNGGLISPPPNQANQGLVNPRFQSFNPPFNPLDPRQACTGQPKRPGLPKRFSVLQLSVHSVGAKRSYCRRSRMLAKML